MLTVTSKKIFVRKLFELTPDDVFMECEFHFCEFVGICRSQFINCNFWFDMGRAAPSGGYKNCQFIWHGPMEGFLKFPE